MVTSIPRNRFVDQGTVLAQELARLTDDDINNMNQNFPSILKTITTKYNKMDKNKFIDIVKSKQEYLPEFDITERG